MKLIRCELDEIELPSDQSDRYIPSTIAMCLECDHVTESYGTHDASKLRCLAIMREDCPLKAIHHYYADDAIIRRLGTRVVNVKVDPYEIYIGRDMSHGSGLGDFADGTFGNPIRVGARCDVCFQRHETGGDTLPCYQQWLYARIGRAMTDEKERAFLSALLDLRGKVLGCWCDVPEQCHGHVIKMFVDSEAADEWRAWLDVENKRVVEVSASVTGFVVK